MPDDLDNYVQQIERVLEPGGRAFITMFLLNDTTEADIRRGASTRTFPFDHGVYRAQRQDVPEHAVAYDEAYIQRLFAERGLPIRDPIHSGGWSRRKDVPAGTQDIVIAVKPA